MERQRAKWLMPRLRQELWRRFRAGESASDISRALAVTEEAIWVQINRTGGIQPCFGRRRDALTEVERHEIAKRLEQGWSLNRIASLLQRAASTISREVKRNSDEGGYRVDSAEWRTWRRARRPKPCKLRLCRRLRNAVARKLRIHWSPQQIARWLRRKYGHDGAMQVSHETIYKTLFVQARGALKKELVKHLRTGRQRRKPRRLGGPARESVVDGVSIRERPAEVDDRAVPGHWEGDLLMGDVHSCVITLVERTTRYCMLAKVDSKETLVVVAALQKLIKRLPTELRRSITWDRGSELAAHARFTVETNVPVYFCDPRSPWQRGSNENTNGLLRQYFPKGKDVSHFTQAELDKIARQLNGRPRMTLDWHSPAEALNEVLR